MEKLEIAQEKLLDILEKSKDKKNKIGTASANAATILNAARFPFSGMDLKGVQIPGADLSNAVLDAANLSNSNIAGVSLRNAFLKKTDFSKSCMDNVAFGEMPYLEGHSDSVNSVSFNHDGSLLASGSEDHTVKVWDMETKTLVWTTNPQLYCKGLKAKSVRGLSETNRRLLEQRGAIISNE